MAWPNDYLSLAALDSGTDLIGGARQTIHDTTSLLKDVLAQVDTNETVWHTGNHGPGSTLSAAYLGGETSSYFRNASNMNAGILPSSRLPTITGNDIGSGEIDRQNIKFAYSTHFQSISDESYATVTTTGGLYNMHTYLGQGNSQNYLRQEISNGYYVNDFRIYNSHDSNVTAYITAEYVQASPPYSLHGYDIPLFIQAIVNKRTLEVTGMSVAPDPVWANNGSHDLHRIGRYQQFVGSWGMSASEVFKNPQAREYTRARKALWLSLTEDERQCYLSKPWSAEEKNVDMNQISSGFGTVSDNEMIVQIDSANDLLPELLQLHEECSISQDSADNVGNLFETGHLKFTEAVDLTGPGNVQMMKVILK